MGPHTQTLLHVRPTLAAFLRREARGHSYHPMTGSLSLVFKNGEKRAPDGIMDAFREMVVVDHSCDV